MGEGPAPALIWGPGTMVAMGAMAGGPRDADPRGAPGALMLRSAVPDDVGPVVALIESAYRGDRSRRGWTTEADLVAGARTGPGEVEALIASPRARMLVAELGGTLVGCCGLRPRPGRSASFGMLAVRPARQGSGTGRALVGEAERIARDEWSAERMTIEVISVRRPLIAWYRRLGYRPTGRTRPFPAELSPVRPGLEFAVLSKSLNGDR